MLQNCPICRAALPTGGQALQHAVCPVCFAVFEHNEGKWQQVPPGWNTGAPVPLPLGTSLRLRSIEYRVAGFASYSYQEEYGRDQWDTYERHEYTLTDLAGTNPRLLCWTSYGWFLARPVDPAQVHAKSWSEAEFEGRSYRMQQPRSYTSDRACGFLAHPFRWRELVSLGDFVSERWIIAAERPGRQYRWVGEQLDAKELLISLAMTELPPAYRSAVANPPGLVAPSPAVATAHAAAAGGNSVSRLLGVLLAVLVIFGVIGTVAYQYELRTKPVTSHWIQSELKPVTERITVPQGAKRLQMDPHFPMGALDYRIRILNIQGGELETRKDYLDMHPKRRTVELALHERAATVEVTCNLTVKVQGMTSWPVEIRFLR